MWAHYIARAHFIVLGTLHCPWHTTLPLSGAHYIVLIPAPNVEQLRLPIRSTLHCLGTLHCPYLQHYMLSSWDCWSGAHYTAQAYYIALISAPNTEQLRLPIRSTLHCSCTLHCPYSSTECWAAETADQEHTTLLTHTTLPLFQHQMLSSWDCWSGAH